MISRFDRTSMRCGFASFVFLGGVCLQHVHVSTVRRLVDPDAAGSQQTEVVDSDAEESQQNETVDPDAAESQQVKMLQWNPHYQCADFVHCHTEVNKSLVALFSKGDIDFANVVELDGLGGSFVPPDPYVGIDGSCIKDQTSLFYNSKRWQTVGIPQLGCMAGGNNRPYIVQGFKSRVSQLEMTVVGAHFPHPVQVPYDGLNLLRDAVKVAGANTEGSKVLFAADTNLFTQNFSMELYQSLPEKYPSLVDSPLLIWPWNNTALWTDITGSSENIIDTALELTCCLNDGFKFPFDRIIANFGSDMRTEVLFGDPVPDWASVHGSEFHKAIVGSFTVALE